MVEHIFLMWLLAPSHPFDYIFVTTPGGYRAANTSKLQLRPDTGTAIVKGEEAESEKYGCCLLVILSCIRAITFRKSFSTLAFFLAQQESSDKS